MIERNVGGEVDVAAACGVGCRELPQVLDIMDKSAALIEAPARAASA